MEKVKFNLGQTVYCFRPQDDKPVSYIGFILGVSINSGGIIQYTVKCSHGEVGGTDATVALTKKEIEVKMQKFNEYMDKQQKLGEDFFGTPEFDLQELVKGVMIQTEEQKG